MHSHPQNSHHDMFSKEVTTFNYYVPLDWENDYGSRLYTFLSHIQTQCIEETIKAYAPLAPHVDGRGKTNDHEPTFS